jgi:hypothetical protein
MRTDDNNNPTAFTTGIAKEAGLRESIDFISGTPFPLPSDLITAFLTNDPIVTTIKVIDKIGFYTSKGSQRWTYIAIPQFLWSSLTFNEKRDIIGFMYEHEGGIKMRGLFPNYGQK